MMVETTPPTTSTTCPRDGAATRLTCGRCSTPICPTCLVRTVVGMRCPACAPTPDRAPARGRRRGRIVVALVASLVGSAIMVAGTRLGERPGPEGEELATLAIDAPGIGEELAVGGLAVTVTRFTCALDEEILVAGRPTRRCETTIRVRNDRFATQDFTGSLQRASDGFRRFSPSRLESPDMGPNPVGPGAVVDVDLVYRVSGTVEPSRLELRASARQAPVQVSLRA